MSIKGVIFDFNGTLYWDTALHNMAWDFFLEKNSRIHGKNNIPYTIATAADPETFIKAIGILGLEANDVLIFEDSNTGIEAEENASVCKIIIVNSNESDYSKWNHQVITSFEEVDRALF